jgi:plasmid maintenance system killer protein
MPSELVGRISESVIAVQRRQRGANARPTTGSATSLFVTKNWRLTFRIDQTEVEIIDLDYEDYH